ncbi:putative transcription elongation factor A protein 3 [Triplophysa rosa]|uniref:Transcription elongation factor A protein 3 n=1 Tax=Triplophysa rosa TaxID=992332 RepID=A0A9W7WQ47_TRIRA|nr:putative transcription elongation factor A protein 3 [Triplophysa rosa]
MTREEDLLRIAKKLDKMVSRNNMDGALDLLKELKSFNMTLKLLQDTRIGMSVNGIRKHCTDEDVVNLAKVLIKNWKKLLESAQNQKSEKPNEVKNGNSTKPPGSPNRTSAERELSPQRSTTEIKLDLASNKKLDDKHREKRDAHLRKEKEENDHKKEKQSCNNKKEPERKDTLNSDVVPSPLPHSTPPPKSLPAGEVKRERKDSTDSKKQLPRKPSLDGRRDRRDSTSSKSGSSPQAKKSGESKGKPETPTTPTSPLSPSFSSWAGPLSPHLQTGDSIRDKCIEMLAASLRTDDDYKDYGANCETMAAEIEDHILPLKLDISLTLLPHIYQEIKATDMKYKNRIRSRMSNLKDPKNPNLRKNVLAGAIELSRIASMTAEEMASDELKQLRNVLTQEAIREHQMAKTGGTSTDLLQCGKCKKRNCTYNQVQTRSADEPMTTFVLCNECGNRWKQTNTALWQGTQTPMRNKWRKKPRRNQSQPGGPDLL